MNRSDHSASSDLKVIYSLSNAPYQRWQAELLDYSIRATAQPGTVIRICSNDPATGSLDPIPDGIGQTFETRSFAEIGDTWHHRLLRWTKRILHQPAPGRFHFFCLNKPFGMRAYLEAHPELPDETPLLWLDPDMVFHRPWDPRTEVRPGQVIGQRWWGYEQTWAQSVCKDPNLAPNDVPRSPNDFQTVT